VDANPVEEDGLLVDARSYANDYAVSVEEAVGRLVAQGEYAEMVGRVASIFPETFAGSDIDHADSYALLLYFTEEQDARAVANEISGVELSRPQVRIDTSALLNTRDSASLVENIVIPAEFSGVIDGLNFNPASNSIEFDVLRSAVNERTAAKLELAVTETADTLGLPVPKIFIRSKETSSTDGHSGGLHLP